ncbi:MAG: histidine phosphatase family protein [Lachnospiraceae bacterium]|nr:histidine phosphatase family protein [Lachnospiraceae bacterium]
MKVAVIRHAEVDFCWQKGYTSDGFDMDCCRYDSAPIREMMYSIPQVRCEKIYISELSRSQNTAKKLFPDGEFIKSELINEVPLKSSFDTKNKMPLWFWNVSGRLQWLINNSRQIEGREQTIERANRFITMICNDNKDCAVVTHGFFMHTLLQEMKKVGFIINSASVKYKNGECIMAEIEK